MAEQRDNPLALPPFPAGSGVEHIDPNSGQQKGRGDTSGTLAQEVAHAVASALRDVLDSERAPTPAGGEGETDDLPERIGRAVAEAVEQAVGGQGEPEPAATENDGETTGDIPDAPQTPDDREPDSDLGTQAEAIRQGVEEAVTRAMQGLGLDRDSGLDQAPVESGEDQGAGEPEPQQTEQRDDGQLAEQIGEAVASRLEGRFAELIEAVRDLGEMGTLG